MNKHLTIGAALGLLAVIIGAFGAHGLEKSLSSHALSRYHTGVEYQFYHVFALITVGILKTKEAGSTQLLNYSGIAFAIGILLFSGSLYLYAITGITKFGMVTPVGGLSFIAGWLFLILFSLKQNDTV